MNTLDRFKAARATQQAYCTFLPFALDAMEFLGFDLTWMQADIAEYMENGPRFKAVFAQRSEAKSTIACLYGLWRLVQNPSTRVVLVSASSPKAADNGKLMHSLVHSWPVLQYLAPDKRVDRTSTVQFDVHHTLKGIVRDASVYCLGITSQMTGFRADLLIPDDVEVPSNSSTPTERAKLIERTKEFSSICDSGDILYLGTPQTKDSIYNTLPARGFDVRIWPGRYPSEEHRAGYGDRLAPNIAKRLQDDPTLVSGGGLDGTRGKPTDPDRMSEASLQDKELDQGPETFELQFMLNTKLMDAARQQLRMRDLIVLEAGATRVPEVLEWSASPSTRVELPTGFPVAGASLHAPAFISKEYGKLTRKVMTVDPASEGGDELAFAVGGVLGPYIHVLDWGGLKGGMSEENMTKLLDIAKENECDRIVVERNLGGGIATKLLISHAAMLDRKVGITDVTSTGQKERRIIDCIGPIMRRHRLVMHMRAIERDIETIQDRPSDRRSVYSGLAQMDSITTDRGCLQKDDRIDVLEQLCRDLGSAVVQDENRAAAQRRAAEGKEFMLNPMGYVGPHPSHRGSRGPAAIRRLF